MSANLILGGLLGDHPNTYLMNLDRYHGESWRRTTRAIGGYWSGDFIITADRMKPLQMGHFFDTYIGHVIKEITFGVVTWEGQIVQIDRRENGVMWRRTMDPERWHNRVKVIYTYPRSEDNEQGSLTYNPAANSFQDEDQDFSDWETLAGNAVYEIVVTNTDASTCRGYLGASFTTTNANDSIYVYTDLALSTAGWNGTTAAKTPNSYIVRDVDDYGVQQESAWAENTNSTGIYGDAEYIEVMGESYATPAEAHRDRRLAENAYPKSVPVGGLARGEESQPDELRVYCAGAVHTINRRYRETDTAGAAVSTQISTLVGESEFVTAGRIDTNSMIWPITCSGIPSRLWDLIEEMVLLGDSSGNRWVGAVYNGRVFDYYQAESAVTHLWQNGRLLDLTGYPVPASMIRPDIIVQVAGMAAGVQPPGGSVWDNPRNVYIEEVEYVAPNQYRLTPYEGGTLVGGE